MQPSASSLVHANPIDSHGSCLWAQPARQGGLQDEDVRPDITSTANQFLMNDLCAFWDMLGSSKGSQKGQRWRRVVVEGAAVCPPEAHRLPAGHKFPRGPTRLVTARAPTRPVLSRSHLAQRRHRLSPLPHPSPSDMRPRPSLVCHDAPSSQSTDIWHTAFASSDRNTRLETMSYIIYTYT